MGVAVWGCYGDCGIMAGILVVENAVTIWCSLI